MPSKLLTGPTAEPVTLDEAKRHLRVEADITDDDALITALIVAAREGAEHLTGRALLAQTWELALDAFADEISLPHPPLTGVTSIQYVDPDGALQTLAADDYLLDSHSTPVRLTPAYGVCWPDTRRQANAVLIRYTAGYADAASVPAEIKSWMLLRIGMLYENRESVIVGERIAEVPFVDRLLDRHRVWSL